MKTSRDYSGSSGGAAIFAKGTGGAPGYAVWIGQRNGNGFNNKIGFIVDTPPGGGWDYATSTDTLPVANDGNWHHVVLAFDATQTSLGATIYFDGVNYGYVTSY